MAKDALFQYKALTQQACSIWLLQKCSSFNSFVYFQCLQVAIKSLETVIQRFLELAQQKTEDAQKTSIEKVEEIDDLDQADAPEK